MKTILRVLYLGMSILLVGCDPGMTIRQDNPQNVGRAGSDAAKSPVLIHVKSTRQLIGETFYSPEIQITNSLESPITITSVELVAQSGTCASTFPRPETYPKAIQPQEAEPLRVLFRLDNSVRKTFERPAELRVHYRADKQEGIANASSLSAPLNDAP
jgi:hypothetical protein